jgi:tetratricopeptide (TPR) repeat protein
MAELNNKNAAPNFSEQNKHEALVLKYKNVIIGGIVALIVGIAVGFFVKNCSNEKFTTASTDMAKAQEYFASAVMGNDSVLFQKALNGDSINAGFLTIIEQDGSGKVVNLAKLYAGICYARLGNLQEAASYLEQYDAKDDEMVSPAALGALGNVKASLGQLDEAVATLIKAADKADNNALSPQFLIQAGEILESQGKKAEALELYERIKAKYADWQRYNTIDNYIERVK